MAYNTGKHDHLYFHVFSKEVPDDWYPDCETEIVISDNFMDKTSEEYKGFKIAQNSTFGSLGNGIQSHSDDSKVSYHFPETGREKLRAWDFLSKWVAHPEKYYYHGLFMKADNFGRFYFKRIDPDVQRAFNYAKAAKKFGI